ncbi:MFS transporter [Fodinisporobacter ferrooxydans]|uniref:MFS transporter n=1 Tax=Fodinisporobacter ferrooxydans TaxID=2901836 RepID=A0ABY4CR29_9BACL|nr:MFS transporter [Alicyclobacillaceae bacterium MYW30-H2]
MQRLWTRDFILVTLSTFFVFMNLQMITPALSSYIHSSIGGNSLIGLSIAAWAVTAVLTRFAAGKALLAVDKRILIWLGILVYGVATAGYYLATSVGSLLIVRILYGIGFGLTTTTYGTLAADLIPATRLGEGMGYFGLSTSLAMAIAPVIGIGMYNTMGFHPLVYTSFGLVLLTIAILPLIRTLKMKQSVKRQHKPQSWIHDFYDPSIILPCILLLLMSITYGGLVSFITLFGKEVHIANVGWYFLVNAGAVVLVRPVSGKLYDKKGHRVVLPIGAVCLTAGLLLLSYAANMGIFLFSAICYGMGYGILQPALQAWMFERLSPERRGIGSGAFYSSVDFGIAVGSMLLGTVATAIGYAAMYRVSAICMAMFMALYLVFGLREKNKEEYLKSFTIN